MTSAASIVVAVSTRTVAENANGPPRTEYIQKLALHEPVACLAAAR